MGKLHMQSIITEKTIVKILKDCYGIFKGFKHSLFSISGRVYVHI